MNYSGTTTRDDRIGKLITNQVEVMRVFLSQRKSFVHLLFAILILEENHTVLSNVSGEIGSMLSANVFLNVVITRLI